MPASVAMLRGRQVLFALLAQSAVALQLQMGGTTRSLSPDTAWRLSLRLASPSAAPGTRPTSVTATVRFDEEQGYEPPQEITLPPMRELRRLRLSFDRLIYGTGYCLPEIN